MSVSSVIFPHIGREGHHPECAITVAIVMPMMMQGEVNCKLKSYGANVAKKYLAAFVWQQEAVEKAASLMLIISHNLTHREERDS